jgi:hypothetical protein
MSYEEEVNGVAGHAVAPNDDYPLYFSVYQNLSDPVCADCPDEMSLLVSGKQTAYQVVLAPTGHTNASILGVPATASSVTSQSTFIVQLLQHARILSEERPQGEAARKAFYAEVQQAISVAMQNLDGQSALQLVVATCSILNNMTLSSSQGVLIGACTIHHCCYRNIRAQRLPEYQSSFPGCRRRSASANREYCQPLSVAQSGLLQQPATPPWASTGLFVWLFFLNKKPSIINLEDFQKSKNRGRALFGANGL